MNEKFEQLIERAAQLLTRIEAVLPQPLTSPDWNQSIAWRYRKRSSGHGALEERLEFFRHFSFLRNRSHPLPPEEGRGEAFTSGSRR